ncbi:glucosaminidase domain-containing protein [Amycolatopsis sp. NPDC003865]
MKRWTLRAATAFGALALITTVSTAPAVAAPATTDDTRLVDPARQRANEQAALNGFRTQSTSDDYIALAGPIAQQVHDEFDIPASVTAAQSILESDWGRSTLTVNDKNYFGFKCVSPDSPGGIAIGCHAYPTTECDTSGCHPATAYFRVYASMTDSFRDYGRLLTTFSVYADALPYRHDPDAFIQHVAVHYATDPDYATKVIGTMQANDLYRFDTAGSGGAGSVAAVYEPNTGTTEVFARGAADNRLVHTYNTGGTWHDWSAIGGWQFAGRPAAVYQANTGTTEVFARGTDGKLIHTDSSAWGNWSVLADWQLAGDPAAVYEPDTGATAVFARGADGKLVHIYKTADNVWHSWTTLGGWQITGTPSVVHQAATRSVDVFARGTDGKLVHIYKTSDGTWHDWSAAGGWQISGDPVAVYQAHDGNTEVFARGTDGKLVHNYSASGWNSWSAIGDWTFTGTPSAIYEPGTRTTEVFARGSADNRLIHTYNTAGTWHDWSAVGGWQIAGSPSAVYQDHDGNVEAFARGTDGKLIHNYSAAGWNYWSAIGDWTIAN